MLNRLVSSNQPPSNLGVKMILYGNSGVGKTCQIATLPAPILLSAEEGTLSIRKENLERIFGVGTPGICYDIPIFAIKSTKDLQEAFAGLKSSEGNAFKSVGFDSISEICEVVKRETLAKYRDRRLGYADLGPMITDMLRSFRDLPGKHVLMIAQPDKMRDPETGVEMQGVDLSWSRMSNKAPFFMDEVLRMAVNKDENGKVIRYIQCQPDNIYQAKDRSGKLSMFEPANVGQIVNKILN